MTTGYFQCRDVLTDVSVFICLLLFANKTGSFIIFDKEANWIDIYNKPSPQECLAHYGIKGMKWGVRRTPEQLGHLKDTYRSKVRTASDHYQRAINRVNDSRGATTKRDRRSNEGLALDQYAKALKYEKQARQVERKLKKKWCKNRAYTKTNATSARSS